ncbi:MAG: nitroreductase family protein [Fermentimonas sp.]|jgi:nitroreductase|nr:nitroreductase family protein [Fermentimonas sp.]NLC85921.1 NAD(P)H nitroreductase [Bacteroidales bacterium]HBT86569.1 NAD(P)H nitroreductase [Porphyromonadaceae bacterium]MDD2930463.1 nitroreductase family protein [Fermentimonas sp.]MDD3188868.1 nitroreductase family protein [Fermentimonas sp.]
MKDFQGLQIRRRSIRKYKNEQLTPEETKKILEAALLSPTSKNKHSWTFIAVEDKGTIAKLSECKPHSASFISDAPLVVVVAGNPLISDAYVEDASIAAFNMQLQAEELNIGSCWIQVRNRSFSDKITSGEYINDLLDIPMPLDVVCMIAFGRKETSRTPADIENLHWEKVHIDKYVSDLGNEEQSEE